MQGIFPQLVTYRCIGTYNSVCIVLQSAVNDFIDLSPDPYQVMIWHTCTQHSREPSVQGWKHPPWRYVPGPARRIVTLWTTLAAQRWQSPGSHWPEHPHTSHIEKVRFQELLEPVQGKIVGENKEEYWTVEHAICNPILECSGMLTNGSHYIRTWSDF